MKIFILGNWDLHYSWFIRTFEQGFSLLGHDVYGIDLKNNNISTIKSYINSIKPDYLFDHMSFRPWPFRDELFSFFSSLRKKNTRVIHVLSDAYLERYRGDLTDIFDFVLLGKLENIDRLRKEWKVPVFYCLYSSLCYDDIAPVDKRLAFKELVFTGNPDIHNDRSNFLRRLSSIMDLRMFFTQRANDMRDRTRELASSCTAILGACTGYDVNGYIDVRPFQYLGAGACMIMRKFKNMDEVIPDDLYYPFDSYNDPYVVQKLHEEVLKTDTRPIRRKAFNFIQTHHNCKKRMQDIINIVEGKSDHIPQTIREL
jgi:hypothetical protein